MHSNNQIKKLRRFLLIKEIIMYGLVGLSFVFLALEHFEQLNHEQLIVIEFFEVGVALIFLAEFVFEWYFARDRARYLRHNWFYLIAAVPVPTTSFEILRGVRLLRLFKLLKIFAHMRYEHNTRLFE
ncbi:ion transporter [Candidatus Saccharibacteria bacterium]|nr:MAG: ion transporter [Candidatus Saccharibacteria bacterium]